MDQAQVSARLVAKVVLVVAGVVGALYLAYLIRDVIGLFLIEAAFWFLVAAGAGYYAFRAVRAGAPPTPDLAIEEARRTKETLEAGSR